MSGSARLAADIGDVALVSTFLLCLAFVLVYAITSRWWQYEAGRNMMAFMAALAAVTGLATLRLVYPGGEVFLWLRVAVFAFVPALVAWRLWMLIRIQILRPDEKEDDDARSHT